MTYIFLFIALYFEVFLLINYFELVDNENKLEVGNGDKAKIAPDFFPSVSIIVPVWNEERTVSKTIFSLLNLDYPKDKLSILVVDDGSTDNTWQVLQGFAMDSRIKLLSKQNGGKHSALNYALEFINSDLVGCLDADSYVSKNALLKITPHFKEEEMMAVTPSIIVFEPKGILQMMQKAEYMFGIFLRRVFSHLGAIYITPGPFSIFRRSVFNQIGEYRHAHNTEDMEIGMRMQKNGMKIGNAHDAYVYTSTPSSIRALYKQRLRWVYGFIRNAFDYKDMFFKPQYGHLGVAILPAAGFSIVSTMYIFGSNIIDLGSSLFTKIKEIYTVGLYFGDLNLDLFYFDTSIILFISLTTILGTLYIIATSRKLAGEKGKFGLDSLLFIILYTIIAPFWMSRAIFNAVFARETKWR